MTNYMLSVGYNQQFIGRHSEKFAAQKLLISLSEEISKDPKQILKEVYRLRKESASIDEAEFCGHFFKDALWIRPDSIIISAEGGGEARNMKEQLCRAFCRIIIAEMNKENITVNLMVGN